MIQDIDLNRFKRFFAFGCSFTKYKWPTWADILGTKFEEYYNFGRGGACNTYIMNKFIEADTKYKFNWETDYIVIMFTNFNRFSYKSMNISVPPY